MPWQIQFARTSGSGLQVDQPPLPLRKHAARPLVQPPVFEHMSHQARPAHLSRAPDAALGGRVEGGGRGRKQRRRERTQGGRKRKIYSRISGGEGGQGMFDQARRLRQLQALAAKKFPNPEVC